MIVTKFGGTSLANSRQMKKVKEIIGEVPEERRIVVVSAPGKDEEIPYKVTDLLLVVAGDNAAISYLDAITLLQDRFSRICRQFNLSELEKSILSEIDSLTGRSRDFIASRGEYWNAQIMSKVLGIPFHDAKDYIILTSNGNGKLKVDLDETSRRLQSLKGERFVFPGFYGTYNGEIRTLSRGGSDLTGSVLANAFDSVLYENWTDVDGLFYADPRIVNNPRVVPSMTYEELAELTYAGFNAFHDEAAEPLRAKGLFARIRNTNKTVFPGTMISNEPRNSQIPIAGIAGKKGFVSLEIRRPFMNREVGVGAKVLTILAEEGISYEHAPSGINHLGVIVENSPLFIDKQFEIEKRIKEEVRPEYLRFVGPFALYAIVGEGMRSTPGMLGRIANSLGNAGINIETANQGHCETTIILGVAEKDYEKGIQALYHELVT